MITKKMREDLYLRSDGRCEAMVFNGRVWTRCWKMPIEIHHLLTRARGGHILDQFEETYHLVCLCTEHHNMSDGKDAYDGALLIDGYVSTGRNGRPVYHGSDPELNEKYGVR